MEIELAALLAPLEGQPAGEEPNTIQLYDDLVSSISKLDGIDKVSIEWADIDSKCQQLLSQHTKDLKVANILVFAWYQQSRFDGLLAGFELLNQLITSDYAEHLFPRRKKRQEKARAAPFIWLETKLEKDFTVNPIEDVTKLAGAEQAINAFTSLTASLGEYLGDETPPFAELKTSFRRFSAAIDEYNKNKAAEEEAARAEQQAEKAQATQAQVQAAAKPKEEKVQTQVPVADIPKVSSSADITKALNAAGNALKAISAQMKGSNPFAFNAFYLNRTAKWMLIQELPATGILPRQPNDQSLQAMQQLESDGNFEELLNSAEREFDNGAIFCISLHRHAYNALVGLGQAHCAEVVLNTTLNFVNRFPKLLETNFQNGEPFVDELTKTWLASASGNAPGGQSSSDSINVDGSCPWSDASAEANKLLAEGKTQQAIDIFKNGMAQASTIRESVYWRYEMASLLAKAGYHDIVVMKLHHLKQTLDDTAATLWQPELQIGILKLMLESYNRLGLKGKHDPEKLKEISQLKSELVKLSPTDALAFTESNV